MIKIMCDRCGSDCDLVGYDIRINAIHNPTPHSIFERGEPKLSDDDTHIRFTLCQNCYRTMSLPNIYMAQEAKKIVWREEDFLPTIIPADADKEGE